MIAAIPLTLKLLVVIGIYELVAGIGGLTGRINWRTMLDEFDRSPALTFITGFMVYVLGAVVILVHCIWTSPLAIIVSATGCIAAAEGLLIMIVLTCADYWHRTDVRAPLDEIPAPSPR